ncbi:MAG: phosphatase PAP2 family protein [Bacteroidota bacterium]
MKRIAFTIILLVIALSAYSQNVDIDILKAVNVERNKNFDAFFIAISDSVQFVAWLLPVGILLFAFLKRNIIVRNKGIFTAVVIVSQSLIATLIKLLIDRPRPFETYSFIEKISVGGSPSFPSGHTSDAFAIALAMSIVFPKKWVIFPMFAWAIAVGYSRMFTGVHYPTDVLGGMLLGLIISAVWYKVFLKKHYLIC